jgi:ketosteroid isomerase-like protein
MKCPKCGTENPDGNTFCNQCGAKLAGTSTSQPTSQNQPSVNVDEGVRGIIVKRFDAIKNKDEAAVAGLMDEGYDKFDDWAPYQRQDRSEALGNEFSAFKVMSNYNYELKDLKTRILGDIAIATFAIHYQTSMRNQQFDVISRVTTVLKRQDSTWKIVHEHLSRFPQERPANQQQFQRRRGGFGFPF